MKKLVVAAGFVYGLVLSFFALWWGVDGPTLTSPLAASPLNVPAAIFDSTVLIIVPIIAAPFCWAVIAYLVASASKLRSRRWLGAVLIVHYIGIALWFLILGSEYLLRPFDSPLGVFLLAFYAVGQVMLWQRLLRDIDSTTTAECA